ncbi:protein adenylyltransferase SelO [Neptuniibacter sp. QD57_21]|uniref:protein adenylyltransferase SelO n=1 Tax=Neptuniibacter sp. QD57_21 TaxID=3398213 RepID=UPI0039F4D827
MIDPSATNHEPTIDSLDDLAAHADYSLLQTLNPDPEATKNGIDHFPREIFSGHYVPVNPTPINKPEYITHSYTFFRELGFKDTLAQSAGFKQMFSGDLSQVPEPLRKQGWACGYALSIYGNEYYQQCPFGTGNGYGDGRAVSVLEGIFNDKRWEMQLKGGGQTPYCRGADGRAVLRSSVREFLAQEHMHALGVPTSRSLSLYVSKSETVRRPWYSEGSHSHEPDTMVYNPVAITTRVAPSFIRVGQLELFGRRARKQEHPKALEELEMLVLHLIEREYSYAIDKDLSLTEKALVLAQAFRDRLTSLVSNWIRVGYCQGNFNSDNCAAGGFTLDYGPYGFMDEFDPQFQPWTGGGHHFSFLNQPLAAEQNFHMFCVALAPLLQTAPDGIEQLSEIRNGFAEEMTNKMEAMWAAKLGLHKFEPELVKELLALMTQTQTDYTLFFRELSNLPESLEPLTNSFYQAPSSKLSERWEDWLKRWNTAVEQANTYLNRSPEECIQQMKQVNPKYTLREWFVQPAYQQATEGNYELIRELQKVMTQPYAEQSQEVEDKFYRLRPAELNDLGGLSHYSCSS